MVTYILRFGLLRSPKEPWNIGNSGSQAYSQILCNPRMDDFF